MQVGAFDRPECSDLRSFADNHRVVIAGGFFGGTTATVQANTPLLHLRMQILVLSSSSPLSTLRGSTLRYWTSSWVLGLQRA
jgi:hypothetical protein